VSSRVRSRSEPTTSDRCAFFWLCCGAGCAVLCCCCACGWHLTCAQPVPVPVLGFLSFFLFCVALSWRLLWPFFLAVYCCVLCARARASTQPWRRAYLSVACRSRAVSRVLRSDLGYRSLCLACLGHPCSLLFFPWVGSSSGRAMSAARRLLITIGRGVAPFLLFVCVCSLFQYTKFLYSSIYFYFIFFC
jgi:hypothetical protein